jgi:hypothetical protein
MNPWKSKMMRERYGDSADGEWTNAKKGGGKNPSALESLGAVTL